MSDLIDSQAAIDAVQQHREGVLGGYEYDEGVAFVYAAAHNHIIEAIKLLPSAHPEDKCSECDAWNKYKNYPREQQWIPCSEPPKESGTYIVTAYDGTDKRVSFVKYQKTLKRWDLTGARAYWSILAYKPLPEPWRGEEHE